MTGNAGDHKGGQMGPSDVADDGLAVHETPKPDDLAAGRSSFAVPVWAGDTGRWSWIIIGVLIVLIALLVLAAATRVLVLAALFAVLFGGTFLPVVDWFERHHLKRWMGAMAVAVFLVALAIGVGLVIVYSVVNQVPEIEQRLTEAQKTIQDALNSTSVPQSTVDSIKSGLQNWLKNAAGGAAGALVGAVSDVASLIFGVFISLNILVWVLIQGRQIGAWAAKHMGPIPEPVGYSILASGARFMRGYIWGSTIVGLFNGGVMFVGALIIGGRWPRPSVSSGGSPTTSRSSARSSAAPSPCSSRWARAARPWPSRCSSSSSSPTATCRRWCRSSPWGRP
jgi:hypothetical protein